ncbi:acyl-CoA thioesterase [Alcanivorax hongdengensis A-11-3]|uniref:Acyl-CoA thioesterase n=1 Tax=Alcanivorax hongdengensis A-11-3 TaxID=1177179 RepID=L0WAT1_9GAMM|nr:arylesterase [Alcanivorax hongdengensis]EKF74071.1 acyl-CoA thioesterase [Alcanivorax hongdengensis A-11-3]
MRLRLIIAIVMLLPVAAFAKGVLIMGDSISAAYGIDEKQGWVALLRDHLSDQCSGIRVINASVSGETTAGGRQRLPALLNQYQPELVVIELGGNDGLRGLSPMAMADNLRAMVEASRQAGAVPVLLGMKIPPNYGQQYTRLFEQQFRDLGNSLQVPLMPFFLEGVVSQGQLQQDGIHPTAAAQPRLLANALTVMDKPLAPLCRGGQ